MSHAGCRVQRALSTRLQQSRRRAGAHHLPLVEHDDVMTEQKVDEALKEYEASSKIAPEIQELPFWHAVTLASVGREKEAEPIFRAVFAKEPQWMELLKRLPAAGLMPKDPALMQRILALGPRK